MKNPPARKRPTQHQHKPLAPAQLDAVSQLFSTLSEPSRLQILQQLQRGPASVSELLLQLPLKQANLSKQLGILLNAGIISRRQDGNRAIYTIALPLVFDLCQLVCQHVAHHAETRAAALRP